MPDAAEKVWNQIRECHGGQVNDTRWEVRMKGEGKIAESIRQLHHLSVNKYMSGRSMPEYDFTLFKRPSKGGQMKLLFESNP